MEDENKFRDFISVSDTDTNTNERKVLKAWAIVCREMSIIHGNKAKMHIRLHLAFVIVIQITTVVVASLSKFHGEYVEMFLFIFSLSSSILHAIHSKVDNRGSFKENSHLETSFSVLSRDINVYLALADRNGTGSFSDWNEALHSFQKRMDQLDIQEI